MISFTRRAAVMTAIVFMCATPVWAQTPSGWVGTWYSAQMKAGADSVLPPEQSSNVTLRQIVHITKGGSLFRLRLSNAMGTDPLPIGNVHLAHALSPASADIDASTDRAVTFNGRNDIVIPAGADVLSDPITLSVSDQADLAISFHLSQAPMTQTGHPGSRATSHVVAGDRGAEAGLADATPVNHWYNIAGIEVMAPATTKGIVTFGDSITDGYGITPNSNRRFPDYLAQRLKDKPFTVLNAGIGGNRLLLDGNGANALARFDRDVLSQPGVRHVILLEGVNDLGMLTKESPATPEAHAAMVEQIQQAYVQMIDRAHSHGLKIYGGTIMPYMGMSFYHPEPVSEADRQAINHWIRVSGRFDAVIDFDAAMRDPANPEHLLPVYDSGDHIHPSEAGYKAMADAVDVKLFSE